jgi:hypothetical protein
MFIVIMVTCKKCGKQKRIIGRGATFSKRKVVKNDPCKNCISDGDCGNCANNPKCDLLDNTCVPADATTLQTLPKDIRNYVLSPLFELGELYTDGWNKLIPELLDIYHTSELPPSKFPYDSRIFLSDTVEQVIEKIADYKDVIVGIGPLIINYNYHNIDKDFSIGNKDEEITFEYLLVETYKNINKLDPDRTDDNNGFDAFIPSNTPGKYYIEFDNG